MHLQKIESALNAMREKRAHEKAPLQMLSFTKTAKIQLPSCSLRPPLPSPHLPDIRIGRHRFQGILWAPIKDQEAPEFTGPAAKETATPIATQNRPSAPKPPLTFSKVETALTHFIESQRNIYRTMIAGLERKLQDRAKQQAQKEKNVSEAMGYTSQGQPTRHRPQF